MSRTRVALISLFVVILILIFFLVYYRFIYPVILNNWNELQAEQIENSVKQTCSADIEVNPDSISELPTWSRRDLVSESEILEITCSEVGRLSWECECVYKEE